jgi:hypothetical protein
MRKLIFAAAATALLAGAGLAQAQTTAPAAPNEQHMERRIIIHREGGPEMGGHEMGMRRMHMDPAKMADHLRTVLQLRPDQEPALKAFIDGVTPPPHPSMDDMKREHEAMQSKSMPEKLDVALAKARDHFEMQKKRIEATKRFYSALSPSQQKAFEELHKAMMHHMGGHGPMGGPEGHEGHGMMMKHGDMPPPPPAH